MPKPPTDASTNTGASAATPTPKAPGTCTPAAPPNAAPCSTPCSTPVINQIFGAARRQGRHEAPEAYAFDALITMAERAAESNSAGPSAECGDNAGSYQANSPDRPETAATNPEGS